MVVARTVLGRCNVINLLIIVGNRTGPLRMGQQARAILHNCKCSCPRQEATRAAPERASVSASDRPISGWSEIGLLSIFSNF